MNRARFRFITSATAPDDTKLFVIRRDFSGGSNTRQHASRIGENQAETIENFDIGIPGQTRKINGITLIEDLSDVAGTGALGFEPRGGTNELLVTHGQKLEGWTGTGTFTEHKTDFTTGLQTTIVKATCSGTNGDVAIISNGTDKCFQMLQNHTMQDMLDDNYSCPLTSVLTFYRNRLWALKANLLYWSDAMPSTYVSNTSSAPFDRTTNNFAVTVGAERALIGVRDTGLFCIGSDAVYGVNPSVAPAATDKPEKILDIGCVAGKTACLVGDDVLFLAPDGVRGVMRTQQDKLQLGRAEPLSYPLRAEFESINWANVSKAVAVYWDNKYFLALPTASATYNNEVWVYYPSQQAWMVITGWNVGAWAKLKVSGEERLYYIDSNDGSVYRAWYGTTNNSTAISATIIGREEDCGQPLVTKNGGEIEVEADVAGSGDSLTVSVSLDGQAFQSLGTISLTSTTAPTLPVSLPFSLADSYIVREKFHLDSLGGWRTMQLKIENTDDNTDPIIVYGYNLVTLPEEYQNE